MYRFEGGENYITRFGIIITQLLVVKPIKVFCSDIVFTYFMYLLMLLLSKALCDCEERRAYFFSLDCFLLINICPISRMSGNTLCKFDGKCKLYKIWKM